MCRVAHSCGWNRSQGGPITDSLLCEHWKLEYHHNNGNSCLAEFKLDAINGNCLLMEEGRDPSDKQSDSLNTREQNKEWGDQTIKKLIDRKNEWPLQFVKWG